jgi:hypothetical protein
MDAFKSDRVGSLMYLTRTGRTLGLSYQREYARLVYLPQENGQSETIFTRWFSATFFALREGTVALSEHIKGSRIGGDYCILP